MTSRATPRSSSRRSSHRRGRRRPARRAPTPPATIAATLARFSTWPLRAPSRSTRCKHSAPCVDPMPGHRGRIVAKYGFPLVITLLEPYAFAASKINCWPDLHRAGPVSSENADVSPQYLTGKFPLQVYAGESRRRSVRPQPTTGRACQQRRRVAGQPIGRRLGPGAVCAALAALPIAAGDCPDFCGRGLSRFLRSLRSKNGTVPLGPARPPHGATGPPVGRAPRPRTRNRAARWPPPPLPSRAESASYCFSAPARKSSVLVVSSSVYFR